MLKKGPFKGGFASFGAQKKNFATRASHASDQLAGCRDWGLGGAFVDLWLLEGLEVGVNGVPGVTEEWVNMGLTRLLFAFASWDLN